MKKFPSKSVDLIYIDPPFNTGKVQSRTQIKTERSLEGDRKGFGDLRYETKIMAEKSYKDKFADYEAFLIPRLIEAYRILSDSGSFYFHIDYREVHY
ncbi:MAG: site-specific DNA-methyltransferase, partial [Anaerolineaceae bacterium]|nr:site-specific DNA-methyltransferase [Anaerolineaceae bacterium]